jgi:hypothetical protein
MSEFQFVEKPLFNQLARMGWQGIERGAGIPRDPTLSLREVLVKNEFIIAVKVLNTLEDGEAWLTDSQLVSLFEDFSHFELTDLLKAGERVYA